MPKLAWGYALELFGTWRWLLLLGPSAAVAVAWVFGIARAPDGARQAYFEASAQVIPVLLLALAVESRFLRILSPSELPSRSMSALDPAMHDRAMRRAIPPEYHEIWERAYQQLMDSEEARNVVRWLKVAAAINAVRRLITAGAAVSLIVLVLVVAEWECLRSLATMRADDSRDPGLVSGGILAGLVGVGLIALLGPALGRAKVDRAG